MPKTLTCKDVGVDCDATFTGETEAEVMSQAADHARTEHGFDEIPPELAESHGCYTGRAGSNVSDLKI